MKLKNFIVEIMRGNIRIKRRLMKWDNYLYITRAILKRQKQGLHDWDDDLVIINDMLKEYSTTMEDQIMSIYRRTIKNWDEIKDEEAEDRRPYFIPC